MAMNVKMLSFWDIALCSLVEIGWRFTPMKNPSTSTRLHGAVSQDAILFTLIVFSSYLQVSLPNSLYRSRFEIKFCVILIS
jgi:hypothetical protein